MSKNICERHDFALNKLHRIKYDISSALKFNKDNAEALVELLDYIDSELYDVVDEIEQAKESGISMEARLEKYKDAIEDLGFQRVNE